MPEQKNQSHMEGISSLQSKIIMLLLGILISVAGWFGNTCYNKLISIETDTKLLLVATTSQKVQIDDMKERFNDHIEQHPFVVPSEDNTRTFPNRGGDRNKKTTMLMSTEFILPNNDTIKRRSS